MSDRDALLRKVKALMALSRNNPDRHEAEAAAQKAQELVLKYGLAEGGGAGVATPPPAADPLGRMEVAAPVTRGGAVVQWRCALAAGVARGFLCRVVVVEGPGEPRVGFVGRRSRVQAAAEAWSSLCPVLQKAVDRAWASHRKMATEGLIGAGLELLGLRSAVAGRDRAAAWKQTFLVEAVASLGARLSAQAEALLGEEARVAGEEAERLAEEYYPGASPEGLGGAVADPIARVAGALFGKRIPLTRERDA